MPERVRKQVLGRLPRGWVLGCVASCAALPVMGAESLPASVKACSTITDSLQRLVCYDREVAKFPVSVAKATEKPAPVAQQAASGEAGGQVVASGGTAGTGTAAGSGVAAGGGPAGSSSAPGVVSSGGSQAAAAAATDSQAGLSGPDSTAKPNSPSAAASDAPISAHIASIEHHPNQLVLHLDNGQVWEEVQSVWGDLSLHVGDVVKIDRHFGSYWLNGPHVSSMKVQRKI